MSDNFIFASIPWLAIAFAIEGYFKKPINNFLAHISSALKKREQRIEEIEIRYVFYKEHLRKEEEKTNEYI